MDMERTCDGISECLRDSEVSSVEYQSERPISKLERSVK